MSEMNTRFQHLSQGHAGHNAKLLRGWASTRPRDDLQVFYRHPVARVGKV
jgi:hypothetical protein